MDLNWQKSTRSSGNGGACVEVANLPIEYDNDGADILQAITSDRLRPCSRSGRERHRTSSRS
jgi:hypothetical protein